MTRSRLTLNEKGLTGLVFCLSLGALMLPAALASRTIRIGQGTSFFVETTKMLHPEEARVGDRVWLKMADDLTILGSTVIARGAPALGLITEVRTATVAGIEGQITIEIQNVEAVDGSKVTVAGRRAVSGEDRKAPTIALAIVCCPLLILQKGGNVVIPAGTPIEAVVQEDTYVSIN
ncbi:hypothetical protein JW905_16705 [bacterium]|nr:hypothetical protein [candidate division CSSED10-310 bacterium]